MQLWGAGKQKRVKFLVVFIIAMQFIIPLLPTAWSTWLRSQHHVTRIGEAECTYRCGECADTPMGSKLIRPDLVSNWPFRSQFLYYDIDGDGHTCRRRSGLHTGEYTLRDSCPAELEVRDRFSCQNVKERMLPSHQWICMADGCTTYLNRIWMITSQKHRQLWADNGTVTSRGWQCGASIWKITDAGDGKVFITSWREQRLQDQSGHAALSSGRGDAAKWTLTDAGDGTMLITNSRGHRLHDANGNVLLTNTTEEHGRWNFAQASVKDLIHSDWELVDAAQAHWDGVNSVISGNDTNTTLRNVDGRSLFSRATFRRPLTLTLKLRLDGNAWQHHACGMFQIVGYIFCLGLEHLWVGPGNASSSYQLLSNGEKLYEWIPGAYNVKVLEWIPVKVVLSDENVSLLVDGVEVASFADSSYLEGKIALGCRQIRCDYQHIVIEGSTLAAGTLETSEMSSRVDKEMVRSDWQPVALAHVHWDRENIVIFSSVTIRDPDFSALSRATFRRPLTLELEIRLHKDECLECGSFLQIFTYSFCVGVEHLWVGGHKIADNSSQLLSNGEKLYEWIPRAYSVKVLEWIPVKVVLSDENVSLLVGGVEVASFADSSYLEGKIALGCRQMRCDYRHIVIEGNMIGELNPEMSNISSSGGVLVISQTHQSTAVVLPLLYNLMDMNASAPVANILVFNTDGCTAGIQSGLRWCFVMPQLPTQTLVLTLAFVVAWALSQSGSSQDRCTPEDDEAEVQSLFRRGAQRLAMQNALGIIRTSLALLFRFLQGFCSISCILDFMFIMRPELALPMLLVAYTPLVAMYGAQALSKPTYWVSPPDLNVFCISSLSIKGKIHIGYLLVLQWAAALIILPHADLSRHSLLGTPSDNHLAWYSLSFQGLLGPIYMSLWGKLFVASFGICVGVITPMLLFDFSFFTSAGSCQLMTALIMYPGCVFIYGPIIILQRFRKQPPDLPLVKTVSRLTSEELLSRADTLTNEILDVAAQRHFHTRTNSKPGFELIAQSQELACFPDNVQPAAFLNWKFDCIPVPGKLLSDLALFMGDVVTDTYAWSVFVNKGHVLFAGFLASVSWASTLIQLKGGMVERFFDDAVESATAGVPSSHWIELLDTEKGLESFVSFLVQGYGFFFAGLEYPDIWFTLASVALSLLGLATYLHENGDLEIPDTATTKNDEYGSTMAAYVDAEDDSIVSESTSSTSDIEEDGEAPCMLIFDLLIKSSVVAMNTWLLRYYMGSIDGFKLGLLSCGFLCHIIFGIWCVDMV